MVFDSYGNGNLFERIELRPSEYWHRNCYATFQNDLLGLSQLDYLGRGPRDVGQRLSAQRRLLRL